jgi:hypothetical protein
MVRAHRGPHCTWNLSRKCTWWCCPQRFWTFGQWGHPRPSLWAVFPHSGRSCPHDPHCGRRTMFSPLLFNTYCDHFTQQTLKPSERANMCIITKTQLYFCFPQLPRAFGDRELPIVKGFPHRCCDRTQVLTWVTVPSTYRLLTKAMSHQCAWPLSKAQPAPPGQLWALYSPHLGKDFLSH